MQFCLGIMALYYGACFLALKANNDGVVLQNFKNFMSKNYLILGALIFLFGSFVVLLLRQNHFIYFWDYSGYWTASIENMPHFIDWSASWNIKIVFSSINHDDYNLFLPAIIALPLRVVGCSFSKYVFINYIMFLVPSIFVQALIGIKLVKNKEASNIFVFVCLAFLFAANYYAMLRGYIDVAILLPASIAMYHFIDFDFKKVVISRNFAIAGMLVLGWISRRYFIYFIIGFVAAMLLKAVVVYFKDNTSLKSIRSNFFIITGISITLLLVFFPRFFIRALIQNYAEMYSAYNACLADKFISLWQAFGLYSTIIVVITGLLCAIHKKHLVNYFALVVMIFVSTVVFWQTQIMDYHHKLILNIPIFCIFLINLDFFDSLKNKKLNFVQNSVITICACLVAVNFFFTFSPEIKSLNNSTLFSEKYKPLVRNDIEQIETLLNKLNLMTAGTGDYVYVLASGRILNSDILRKIYLPNYNNALHNLYQTCDVDLRDGFPVEFFNAKYVITTLPVDLHLGSGQEVVKYLAENINNKNTYLGKHYQQIDNVQLDEGYVAIIYKKVSDFNSSDYDKLIDYYDSLYPTHKNLFKERIQKYKESIRE